MKTKAHCFAGFILIATFWGGSFLAIRFSVGAFPPFAAAGMRVAIATAIMSVLMRWRHERAVSTSVKWHLLGIGCFTLGLPWALLFWGEQFVSPALSSIINSTTPIFTTIITAFFTEHEELRWNKWMGVVVGFVGVVIVFLPTVTGGGEGHLLGMLAVAGMSVCYATGIVWLRHVAHRVSPASAFYYQGLGALMLLVPLVVLAERDALFMAQWRSTEAWVALAYLSILSTALAQLIFFVLVREWGSVRAATVTYIVPIVAVALDWVVFGTLVSASAIIGGTIILGGVHLIHARERGVIASVVREDSAFEMD